MLIAVAASFAALWLAFTLRTGKSWQMVLGALGAALVMGAAISGMHYTAWRPLALAAGAFCVGGMPIDNQWLAMVVGLITVALARDHVDSRRYSTRTSIATSEQATA